MCDFGCQCRERKTGWVDESAGRGADVCVDVDVEGDNAICLQWFVQ